MEGSAPILIAYDGSPSADHAIREAGQLLGGRQALVVAIYQPPSSWAPTAIAASARRSSAARRGT